MYIVSSSVMRVVCDDRLFLAAFRYFSKNLFRASMVFGEELNLHQGHGALFQAHNLSLHHLHDLPNESVSAGCPKYLCMGCTLLSRHSVSRFITLVMCNCMVNVVWVTISEVMPAHNWLTRLITCYSFSNVLNTPGC